MRKKTHEEYMAELAIKNPTIEVIDIYVDAKTKIKHHCLIHDVYWDIHPSNALRGQGCEMCRREKIRNFHYKSIEQYINEVKNINPHIEVLELYIDAKTPILHKCTIHNVEWRIAPDNILQGQGCCECRKEKISDKISKTHEQYVKELKEINKNIIVVGNYIDATTPILHKCIIDEYEWMARPSNILYGFGCPKCNESKGEKYIRQWLGNNNILYISQKTFEDCKDKKCLPFDFYLPNHNLCIEFDGEQHYRPVEYFGGEKRFEYIVKHDKIKTEYCANNNIKLLRIPYFKNIEEELNNFLFI